MYSLRNTDIVWGRTWPESNEAFFGKVVLDEVGYYDFNDRRVQLMEIRDEIDPTRNIVLRRNTKEQKNEFVYMSPTMFVIVHA